MFQSLDLFVLVSLSMAVESLTGNVSPPQNLSVRWIDGFIPELSWAPPQDFGTNCTYEAISEPYRELKLETPRWRHYNGMVKGFLQFSVKTDCNGRYSDPAVLNITYPELVRNVQCYIRSSNETHCSWLLASQAPDLSFFYQLISAESSPQLQECPLYISTDNKKTGCHLQMEVQHHIRMMFNGTLNNTTARNTFPELSVPGVRPPPLNWTVIEAGDKFNISWTPPDILQLSSWGFTISYTECGENKSKTIDGETSTQLERLSHCQYDIIIKAKTLIGDYGETPWSDRKHFDADTNPNALVYAAILIPLVTAGLAVLTFVCCRKNKENIFPKVPEPRDLLSDISDNNNKSTVRNLYVPAEEEEDCKITLVIDPQLSKLHS